MHQLNQWATRCGGALRAAAIAVDPGEEGVGIDEEESLRSLDQELRDEFARISRALAMARRRQQGKDTPVHRHAVGETRDRIDAVLDMYLMNLEIHRDRPGARVA